MGGFFIMMIFGHSLLEVGLFCALVIGCLWYDLHSHDDSKPVTAKSAAKWTAIWVSLAFLFAGYIGFTEGTETDFRTLLRTVIDPKKLHIH